MVFARWLSYVSFLLALFTIVIPNWIEALFGVDPDHGNGLLEYLVVLLFLLIGVSTQVVARHMRAAYAQNRNSSW
jgi:hypothetical protein